MEVAKALGGSFKLVTPVPKPVREMTQLLRETQKDGDRFKYPASTNWLDSDNHSGLHNWWIKMHKTQIAANYLTAFLY